MKCKAHIFLHPSRQTQQSSETLVSDHHTTHCNNPKNYEFYLQCHQNIKFCFSWNGFLLIEWWKSGSEIYFHRVNSKIWDYAQANFEFYALEFVLGCAHMTPQVQACIWPMLSVSGFKACHLTNLWVWSSSWGRLKMKLLALISSKFWTEVRRNILQSIVLPQDNRKL